MRRHGLSAGNGQDTPIRRWLLRDLTLRTKRGEFANALILMHWSARTASSEEIGVNVAATGHRLSIISMRSGYMAQSSVLSNREAVCSGFMKRPATCWPRRSAPSGFVFCRREHRIPKDQI